jgi:hypothetical protein
MASDELRDGAPATIFHTSKTLQLGTHYNMILLKTDFSI